uniref:Leucine-rich repeat-containing protein 51 n=1 Tax=Periophthalmus magnuspinnatus TaxID=409849 RepID=A0A3B4B9T5_9GOBI
MYSPPVDLSFRNLSTMTDAMAEIPRRGVRPLTPDSRGRYHSRAVRLNNNNISDLTGVGFLLGHFLSRPSHLGWLDLSFNKLERIDPVLCEMQELRILYLHGNSIWKLSEVDKLGRLPHLHTITLHGNSIESTSGYSRVIAVLPELKAMDFSAVTKEERVLSQIKFTGRAHDHFLFSH